MAANIKGITVEIGGDTTKLGEALKSVNSKSKDLQNELKQVEQLLKLDPTNTELVAQKQKILAEQIENAESKLKILHDTQDQIKKQYENGEIDEGQYREFQRQVVKAEAELKTFKKTADGSADEVNDLEKATDETSDELKNLDKNADKAGEEVKELGSHSENSSKKLDLLKSAAKGAFSMMKNIASVGAGAATAIGGLAVSAGANADDLNTMASQTGVSTEQLQKFKYASDIIDVDLETMAKSLAKTTKAMSEAQGGSAKYQEAFDKLGVSVTDASGNLKDNETVFYESIDALGKVANETERDALAMEIFGKSATDLNPLIKGGAETLKELGTEAENSGLIMSQELLDGANGFNDSLDQMKATGSQAFMVIGSTLATEFAPAMQEANTWVMDLSKSLIEGYQEGGTEGFIDAAMAAINDLLNKIVEFLPQVVELGLNIITSLAEGINSNAETIAKVAVEIITTLISGIIDLLPTILETAITLIVTLAQGIAEALPELIPQAIECILTLIDTLLDNIDLIIDAALQIIEGLAEGLLQALPILVEKAPTIISKLIKAIGDNLPKVLSKGTEILMSLLTGIIQALPDLIKEIPGLCFDIIEALVKGLAGIADVGKELVSGLWDGISSMASGLLEDLKDFGGSIISGFKNVFGIASPSKVMNQEVGRYLSEGVAEGILDNEDASIDAMDKLKKDITNDMGSLSFDMAVNKAFTTTPTTNTTNATNGLEGQNRGLNNGLTIILKYKDLTLGKAVLNDLKELTKINGSNPILDI